MNSLLAIHKRKLNSNALKIIRNQAIRKNTTTTKTDSNNSYKWNLAIKDTAKQGQWRETLQLLQKMHSQGMQMDQYNAAPVLKACAYLSVIQKGKQIHALILISGLQDHVITATALITMYSKCRMQREARQVFDKMPTHAKTDMVLWSSVIAGYAQNNENSEESLVLLNRMMEEGLSPDEVVMISALQACGNVRRQWEGKWIHGHVIKSGFDCDSSIRNTLVSMYSKCNNMEDSVRAFDDIVDKNVVSWTTILGGYAQNAQPLETMKVFRKMKSAGVGMCDVTFVHLLYACADLGDLKWGEVVHAQAVCYGFERDNVVGSSLVEMYAKCGCANLARVVFDGLRHRNLVTWNCLISGYAQNGHFVSALEAFHQMQNAGMLPDSFTITSVLSSCAYLGDLEQGKRIHEYVKRRGLDDPKATPFVRNSLIDMYAKCKKIDIAKEIFDSMWKRDVVSWNVIISGCVQNGQYKDSLEFFKRLKCEGQRHDSETMVSVLDSCAHLGSLQLAEMFHGCLVQSGLEMDQFVQTAIIDMYAKCGDIETARKLFDGMVLMSVTAFSAMIGGYGMHGYGKEAVKLFEKMVQHGIKPTSVTCISLLSACSHSGMVDEGLHYFKSITSDYQIEPTQEHYSCMIDLYSRAGLLDEANALIKSMPLSPGADALVTLLSACRDSCNVKVAESVAEILFDIDPGNSAGYLLLFSIYAKAGKWDKAAKVRTMMKARGIRKKSGHSKIEINSRIHSFIAGDTSHPQYEEIHKLLCNLSQKIKNAGYVAETDIVQQHE